MTSVSCMSLAILAGISSYLGGQCTLTISGTTTTTIEMREAIEIIGLVGVMIVIANTA